MSKSKCVGVAVFIAVTVPLLALAQSPLAGQTPVTALVPDPASAPNVTPYIAPADVIEKIRDEGLKHSQIMPTIGYLTEAIGPRLTASSALKRANEWTRDTMTRWGMQNAHLEAWGPFGRGWVLKNFSAEVSSPLTIPLIAFPKAWSPPTKGTLAADVVYFDAPKEADFLKYKGQLRGKIVLISKPRDVETDFTPTASRWTDEELNQLATVAYPTPTPSPTPEVTGTPQLIPVPPASLLTPPAPVITLATKRLNFLKQEGAALIVDNSTKGMGGTVFVAGASAPQDVPLSPPGLRGRTVLQPYDKQAESRLLPQMTMATEQYNHLVRMLGQGQKVTMKVNIGAEYQDHDPMAYNTIAEIPGTDLKAEVVMLGGHLDSWHAGTGATDNAAGVGVAMEAARIIKALGLKPRRTIRVALWTGEEEGLLGSGAYVKQHFMEVPPVSAGPSARLIQKAEYNQLSAYYNLDNGTGKIRGIYLQANSAVAPIFRAWLKPFADLGATTLAQRNAGGTDHLAFDAVGLPGFEFIQDKIDYQPRTHHSNQDVYDRLQPDDLKQAATVMAAFVYQTAMMDEKLPRKPLVP